MKVLVVGATGATGSKLVRQLLDRGAQVKAIVRSVQGIPEDLRNHEKLELVEASLLGLSDTELQDLVKNCHAIASCLGHNMTFKGLYGKPRRLVSDATRRLCLAAQKVEPETPVKFVLMNSSGNRNRDLKEPISLAQRAVIALLRVLVPPHPDNEQAAEYLRLKIGQNDPSIEWTAVRSDSLIDAEKTSAYETHPSPIRSAIFNAGKVSRINVAHFMAELITNASTWDQWKGKMPVIYSTSSES